MNAIRSLLGATALVMVLPAAALAQDTARGEQLFALCAQCHGDNGGGNPETLAPAIGGLPPWFVAGQLQKVRGGGPGTPFRRISAPRVAAVSLLLPRAHD